MFHNTLVATYRTGLTMSTDLVPLNKKVKLSERKENSFIKKANRNQMGWVCPDFENTCIVRGNKVFG